LAISFALTVGSIQLYVEGSAENSFVIMVGRGGGGICSWCVMRFRRLNNSLFGLSSLELYRWWMNFVLVCWHMVKSLCLYHFASDSVLVTPYGRFTDMRHICGATWNGVSLSEVGNNLTYEKKTSGDLSYIWACGREPIVSPERCVLNVLIKIGMIYQAQRWIIVSVFLLSSCDGGSCSGLFCNTASPTTKLRIKTKWQRCALWVLINTKCWNRNNWKFWFSEM
jgi:hypothetical protein